MKIAVCVSGQLRDSWRDCIPSWQNMFDTNHQVDYFIHTWTNKTAPNAIAHANKDTEEKEISNTEINEVKRLLKPKGILVENPKDFKVKDDMAVFDPNYHSQFYGVMMACHLKQKYEQQYSLQYDLCVRMRFDNLVEDRYPLQKAEEQTVHVIHQTFDKTHRYRCSDVYFSAPSFDYDRICDFYSCLSKYKREWFECGQNLDYGPEHVLAFHIKANHIVPVQTYMPVKLKRAKQEHYAGGSHELIC